MQWVPSRHGIAGAGSTRWQGLATLPTAWQTVNAAGNDGCPIAAASAEHRSRDCTARSSFPARHPSYGACESSPRLQSAKTWPRFSRLKSWTTLLLPSRAGIPDRPDLNGEWVLPAPKPGEIFILAPARKGATTGLLTFEQPHAAFVFSHLRVAVPRQENCRHSFLPRSKLFTPSVRRAAPAVPAAVRASRRARAAPSRSRRSMAPARARFQSSRYRARFATRRLR